ncbi:MAG: hypothetical protein ACK5M7_02780 [Draconibacterium sp.]
MKVNKVQIASILTFSVFIILLAFFIPFSYWLTLTILLAGVFFSFLYLNNILIQDSRLPSMFNDNRRNFDFLLLGSTNIWKNIRQDRFNKEINNKLISFSFFRRSLYGDFIILQRVFSYLKSEGTVLLPIDFTKFNELGPQRLNISDLYKLHEITLLELGHKFGKLKKNFPILFNPVFAINYFYHKIGNFHLGKRINSNNIKEKDIQSISDTINDIIQFCAIRNLNVKIFILINDSIPMNILTQIKTCLNKGDILFVKDTDEIEQSIV